MGFLLITILNTGDDRRACMLRRKTTVVAQFSNYSAAYLLVAHAQIDTQDMTATTFATDLNHENGYSS